MTVPPTLAHDLVRGFNAALVIPATASTLKQAQREAARELHVLADYHRAARTARCLPALSRPERQAVHRVAEIIAEQGINGTVWLLAVKTSASLGGMDGGMLAQVGVTLNTMVTPGQTQAFNPARCLFREVGMDPDWLSALPDAVVLRFADMVGRFAASCGYGLGGARHSPPVGTRSGRDWDGLLQSAATARPPA
ncbi:MULTISPECIES: hypothetical protein [unclassified Azospirillum]|uniref:hypothetical protein n=1 Tax=unclassified Azospirillum TaxID=2630922 RepID=UPI000B635A55|nr:MULTISPECIES: hypothetical protein [unclassified Azospirillum]SNT09388.1 hypothetical protein SAMN05880556_12313 [Azospirillum sp. RU38E]SNT24985.1 hypothetical protein SAMN05880591_12413 [Azospirillum sp. RU37A]